MMKAVSRAFALVALTVSTFASAQDYQDTTPYVVEAAKYPYTVYPQSTVLDDKTPWEMQAVPFSPTTTYTAPEQDTVITGESQLLNNSPVFLGGDGVRELGYAQATIPEANTPNVPPPTETQPSSLGQSGFGTLAATPSTSTYQRTERFGNSTFGAGYQITASVTATPANGSIAKKEEAVGEGKLLGTAFGYEKEMVRGRAYVCGQAGGCNGGSAQLYAMGSQIWSQSLTGASFSTTPINWSRTFFSVSKTFMIGPVPVSVKASLTGGVRMSVSGQVGPLLAAISANAGGFASVVASAAVNVGVASFGVSGSLALINATLTAASTLSWNLCSPSFNLRAALSLNALSGTLKAFVKIKLLFFKKTWDVTIASWSGITKNITLFNYSATFPIISC